MVTAQEATDRRLLLAAAPSTRVHLSVAGGVTQHEGTDFTLSGQQLSWLALPLDGLLAAGDVTLALYGVG